MRILLRTPGRKATVRAAAACGGALLVAASTLALGAAAPAAAIRIVGSRDVGIVDINTGYSYLSASGAGTGQVLTPGGEVLTNNHVIQGATSIRVVVPGSRHAYTGRVIGYDVSADVAVIQLEGASNLQTVRLGDSNTARVGAAVTALGNADGAGGAPRVAPGRVVALRRSITVLEDQGLTERLQTLIETNASLQPGDSGGPLLDSDGRVIGVDTAALRVFGDQPARNQAYAIPIDRALAIARQIESGRRSSEVHVGPTPFLGVDVSVDGQAYRSGRGALIQGVAPSSPAARAGLGAGDVITSLDGLTIASAGSITHVILKVAPGMTIGIAWIGTDGTAHHAHIRLTSGPPQ